MFFFEKETFLYRAVIFFFVFLGSSEESKLDRKYPVVVLIHGESFSWGSGNIYDGRALATYGQLVVITVNFRLGVFGKCYLYVYLQALKKVLFRFKDLQGTRTGAQLNITKEHGKNVLKFCCFCASLENV